MQKSSSVEKKIIVCPVRGFCSGVRRALDTVEAELRRMPEGKTLYVYHEIVHNNYLVESLRQRGVVFVDSPDEIPVGETVIFSAHGVSLAVQEACQRRNLHMVDASCPLVLQNHRRAAQAVSNGALVVLIGHKLHNEVVGTVGQAAPGKIQVAASAEEVAALPECAAGQRVMYLSQTTLSREEIAPIVAALQQKYPTLEGSDCICYATEERQHAVRHLVQEHPDLDCLIVLGSPRSSNSNQLKMVALDAGVPAALRIDSVAELKIEQIAAMHCVALTAGASAPEVLVQETLEFFHQKGFSVLEES